MSDEMHKDFQPSPGRSGATPMLRSALVGLVLSVMIPGSWVLAQDGSQPARPAQTAPGSSTAPAVSGAANDRSSTSSVDTVPPTAPTAQTVGSLPSDLSPWSMFLNADI